MFFLSDSTIYNVVTILIGLLTCFLIWMKWNLLFWQRKGIMSLPTSLIFGNAKEFLSQRSSFGDAFEGFYNYFKNKNEDHGGVYLLAMSVYMPVNPEIVKSILLTDFNHFVDRGVYFNEEVDPLSAHLFSIEGTKWRNLRHKLSSTFTSGKMKMMFSTLVKCGEQLKIKMDNKVDNAPVEIKDILVRFTTDIIGNCAFGIDCNSIQNPDNVIKKHMELFFVQDFWRNILGFITFVSPGLAKMLKFKAINPICSNFFMKIVRDTVKYREKNNIYRKDFMHLLLQLKNRGELVDDENILTEGTKNNKEITLTIDELAAQAFLFFVAGFETSSTTMTFCLLELALNPLIQDKLREEVDRVLKEHNGELTYDALLDMHYMEKVISETLRKYPPLPVLNRICTKKYKIPGTEIILEKGQKIMISVSGLQRDPEYYPNPQKFDPERFTEENKKKRHPYTYIPFGEGPRICIGLRFGMMQTKVGLTILLHNYRFSLNSKTSLPIRMDPRSFIMTTEGGVWLDYSLIRHN